MHNKEGSDEDDVDERSNAKFQHYDDEDDVAGKCGWDLGIRTFPPNQVGLLNYLGRVDISKL